MAAEKPVIAGGEEIRWADAAGELLEFVELTQTPVITPLKPRPKSMARI